MSKQAYRKARRLIRDNGYYAVRWLRMSEASIMLRLKNQKEDALQQRSEDARIMDMAHAYGY